MVTLRNERKFVAINKHSLEDSSRNNQAPNTNSPRSQKDYITQVSDEIVGKVTEKLAQEFSRTKNCISGALSQLG